MGFWSSFARPRIAKRRAERRRSPAGGAGPSLFASRPGRRWAMLFRSPRQADRRRRRSQPVFSSSSEGAMHRSRLIVIASFVLLAALAPAAHAQQYVSAYAACSPTDSTYAIWLAGDPDSTAYPNWVGYDVMRRVHPGCDDYVVANAQIIPRVQGYETFYFQELNPAPGQEVEYRIRPVDSSHQQVFIPGFCAPCDGYTACPALSVPITVGTLFQAGGFVFVSPCPGTCYPSAYLDPNTAAALAPYVGTSTSFNFYGQIGCGGVEGCGLQVDHWQQTTCVTANKTASWGRLKTIYR